LKTEGASILEEENSDADGILDGSLVGLSQFLSELVDMAGQSDAAHSAPVLELQFGNILTTTSLSTPHDNACLSITAFLPRQESTNPQLLSFHQTQDSSKNNMLGDWECLWHADEGRHVIVRKIPIAVLVDERSVMDAIADTSDQAAAWFAKVAA